MSTIQETTNYTQFVSAGGNRDVDLKHPRTKALAEQMVQHGWLDAFPMMVRPVGKKLHVIDGQHRLAVAKTFTIPAKYVVCDVDVDVAKLNSTAKAWTMADYVKRYRDQNNEHYNTLWVFHKRYDLPLSRCIELLSGGAYNGADTREGLFRVNNTQEAREVAEMVQYLRTLSTSITGSCACAAITACRKVEGFDKGRFLENAERCSHMLRRANASKEASLEVFEEIYNFRKRDRMPLKFLAEEAVRKGE